MRKFQSKPSNHNVRFGIFLKNRLPLLVLCGIALAALSGPDAFAAFNGFRAIKITEGQNGFTGDLNAFDEFGSAVAGIGDIDGDGIGDAAVGARWTPDGGSTRGAVWILFFNADHTVRAEQKISSTSGGFTGMLDDGDSLGQGLGSLGDLDGDGIVDLAVGVPLDDDGAADEGDPFANLGAVYILFLNADGTVKNTKKISQTEGGFTGTLSHMETLAMRFRKPAM